MNNWYPFDPEQPEKKEPEQPEASQEQEPSPEETYRVYAKEYTPSGETYNTHSTFYSQEEPVVKKPRKRIGAVGIIAIVLAALLVLSFCSIIGVAQAVKSYYEQQLEAQKQQPQYVVPSETKEETKEGTKVIFSSEEETKIKTSDSEGVTTGGKVGDDDLTYADVAALVAASVVEITTSETSRNGLVYASGAGSGVIVNDSGIILTNHHVIEDATYIDVRLTNGNIYRATLVATDSVCDVAILKIQPTEPLTVAVFGDSSKAVVGEEVIAIGNPLGILGGTVTNGIISTTEREVDMESGTMVLLQHNAAINAGNSGGGLFNMRGELIGIVNAKYSSEGVEGLAFAIPVNTVKAIYEDLVKFGYVKGRPDTGITLATMNVSLFSTVICVYSSRYTDELKLYDILVSIDGVMPTSLSEAKALLADHEIGDTVTIVVQRSSGRTATQHTVTVTVREYQP